MTYNFLQDLVLSVILVLYIGSLPHIGIKEKKKKHFKKWKVLILKNKENS